VVPIYVEHWSGIICNFGHFFNFGEIKQSWTELKCRSFLQTPYFSPKFSPKLHQNDQFLSLNIHYLNFQNTGGCRQINGRYVPSSPRISTPELKHYNVAINWQKMINLTLIETCLDSSSLLTVSVKNNDFS